MKELQENKQRILRQNFESSNAYQNDTEKSAISFYTFLS